VTLLSLEPAMARWGMNDEQLLALGRAVHAFQTVAWLTIWVLCFLLEAYPQDFDPLTFGQHIERLRTENKTATQLWDGERHALGSRASSRLPLPSPSQ